MARRLETTAGAGVAIRRRYRLRLTRLLRDPGAAVALSFLAFLVFVAVFAPVLAPAPPAEMGAGKPLEAPSLAHPLGTDQFGRDVAARLIYGARVSLSVGVIAMLVALSTGSTIGLAAAWVGGRVDDLIMRMIDIILVFPTLILAITLVQVFGAGLHFIMLAIGLTHLPVFARLIRGQALSVLNEEYITAAHVIGARAPRIILRHLFPNVVAPLVVQASLDVGYAILSEASLSFLGVGIRPPTPTWGNMLRASMPVMNVAPWLAIFPGLAIFLTVLSLNFTGDRLRDVLDPRMRGSEL